MGRERRPIVLITGGAGFIGINMAAAQLALGRRVRLLDNLSRSGVEENIRDLSSRTNGDVDLVVDDIRRPSAVRRAVRGVDQVFHFAAQVAVTTSILDPVEDFDVNLGGTLNLLEALRALPAPPPLLFTSTNKIYGDLEDLRLKIRATRYEPLDPACLQHGTSESRPLSFHSPYGCSKGAADQYVLDYSRIYELPCVVFRMSCIYGPHQHGTEDQGWVAHFLRRALMEEPITIYGDGRQVRDILFIDDLIRAMRLALERIEDTRGRAFNIGGGVRHTTSLVELLESIARVHGRVPTVRFSAWRQGDQRYYVSDIRAFSGLTGWVPKVGVREGIARLYGWLRENAFYLPADTEKKLSS